MTTLCLDNSFVSDYPAGEDYTTAFLGPLDDAAEEAAEIRGTLLDRGEPLGAPDVLIAGIAHSQNAEVVNA